MKKPRTHTGVAERLCVALTCGAMELLHGVDVLRVLRTSRLIRSDEGVVGCALRRVASGLCWLERTPRTPMAVALAWRIQSALSRELDAASRRSVHPFLLPQATDGSPSGGALTATQPISTRPCTVLHAHWDHIEVGAKDDPDGDDTVKCALCEACVASVCAYREATEAFTNGFERQLAEREAQWEALGDSADQIFERSYAFQQAYFADDPFHSAYIASQDDATVLAHICQRGRFPIKLLLPSDTTRAALSVGARETCLRVYRPVKRLLTRLCESPRGCTVRPSAMETDRLSHVVAGACGHLVVGITLSF